MSLSFPTRNPGKVETKLPDRLVCVKTNKRNNPVLALIIPNVQQRHACGVRMLLIEAWFNSVYGLCFARGWFSEIKLGTSETVNYLSFKYCTIMQTRQYNTFPFTRCVLSFCFSEESAVRLRGRFVSPIKKRGSEEEEEDRSWKNTSTSVNLQIVQCKFANDLNVECHHMFWYFLNRFSIIFRLTNSFYGSKMKRSRIKKRKSRGGGRSFDFFFFEKIEIESIRRGKPLFTLQFWGLRKICCTPIGTVPS